MGVRGGSSARGLALLALMLASAQARVVVTDLTRAPVWGLANANGSVTVSGAALPAYVHELLQGRKIIADPLYRWEGGDAGAGGATGPRRPPGGAENGARFLAGAHKARGREQHSGPAAAAVCRREGSRGQRAWPPPPLLPRLRAPKPPAHLPADPAGLARPSWRGCATTPGPSADSSRSTRPGPAASWCWPASTRWPTWRSTAGPSAASPTSSAPTGSRWTPPRSRARGRTRCPSRCSPSSSRPRWTRRPTLTRSRPSRTSGRSRSTRASSARPAPTLAGALRG
jgi:hypothetical protein